MISRAITTPRSMASWPTARTSLSTFSPFVARIAPDGMISLTRDGKTFGHRTHTRSGGVAPGFMWCKFDQVLDDEPQPLWIAVLLWGDVQIRLTVIRPTFHVMAFEAPGCVRL